LADGRLSQGHGRERRRAGLTPNRNELAANALTGVHWNR
jgi:hypothetical protein